MRKRSNVVIALSVTLSLAGAGVASGQSTGIALVSVAHVLDGRTLVVSGWVENRGPGPVGRLVVDATGFAPSGEPNAFGSDGIPWQIAPGRLEHFAIRLPVDERLIREYAVQVAYSRPPIRPLTSLRRTVDFPIYRPLLLALVRVDGEIRLGRLTVRADVQRLPVTQVTVEATVLIIPPSINRFETQRLETFILDVPADRSVVIGLGITHVTLQSLRVVGVQTRAVW